MIMNYGVAFARIGLISSAHTMKQLTIFYNGIKASHLSMSPKVEDLHSPTMKLVRIVSRNNVSTVDFLIRLKKQESLKMKGMKFREI